MTANEIRPDEQLYQTQSSKKAKWIRKKRKEEESRGKRIRQNRRKERKMLSSTDSTLLWCHSNGWF